MSTTPTRPIIGTEPATPEPSQPPVPSDTTAGNSEPEMAIAGDLPSWDLVPSDMLLVRKRPLKR